MQPGCLQVRHHFGIDLVGLDDSFLHTFDIKITKKALKNSNVDLITFVMQVLLGFGTNDGWRGWGLQHKFSVFPRYKRYDIPRKKTNIICLRLLRNKLFCSLRYGKVDSFLPTQQNKSMFPHATIHRLWILNIPSPINYLVSVTCINKCSALKIELEYIKLQTHI